MADIHPTPSCSPHQKGLPASIFITLFFAAFMVLISLGNGFDDTRTIWLFGVALAFSSLMIFQMFRSGKINYWRRIFFTTYAVAFVIEFVCWTMGDRGHMWLLDSEMLQAAAPMCHMVVPMSLLPMALTKNTIFFAALERTAFMTLLVLVVWIVYGRSFCSWGCFFGGQDELFSSLSRKPSWRISRLPLWIRYFALGLLVFIVAHSLLTLTPTYCIWFCPFKATSEFIEVNSFVRVIQTFIFVILWAGLAIVLPILSKKRTQCGLFCPMGAFLSTSNKINFFKVKIDTENCSRCGHCISVCPTFSLTEESFTEGKPRNNCTRCGACIDACPKKAIELVLPGQAPSDRPWLKPAGGWWSRFFKDLADPMVIFILGIFILGNVIASSDFVGAMSRILKLFGV